MSDHEELEDQVADLKVEIEYARQDADQAEIERDAALSELGQLKPEAAELMTAAKALLEVPCGCGRCKHCTLKLAVERVEDALRRMG